MKQKHKICIDCGKERLIFAYGRCKYCDAVHKLNQKRSGSDVETISAKREKALSLYSLYRRKSLADKDGFCRCVTCDVKQHYTKIQNGHYVDRQHNSTTFLDKNNHPQCVSCNEYGDGKLEAYAEFLDKTYGKGTAIGLEKRSKQVFKLTHHFLDNLIKDLEKKLSLM